MLAAAAGTLLDEGGERNVRHTPHARTAGAAVLILSLLVPVAACHRRAPEVARQSIEARIDGITCPTCVPPLTASLKRHAESAIDVSDDKDTATIRFAEKENFSAADFRAAVERVRMHVLKVRMQACGTVETSDGNTWLTAGSSRFLLRSDGKLPPDQPICADGTLDTRAIPRPSTYPAFSVQGAPGH